MPIANKMGWVNNLNLRFSTIIYIKIGITFSENYLMFLLQWPNLRVIQSNSINSEFNFCNVLIDVFSRLSNSTEYDHAGKRRKRGSIFFRKKKVSPISPCPIYYLC